MGRLTLCLVVVTGLSCASAACAALPRCLMHPVRQAMSIPDKDFRELKESGLPGRCVRIPPGKWIGESGRSAALLVHADGPSGSGRFWHITVGVADSGEAAPARGFCLETSTTGWRTLLRFGRTPLPWLLDLDADRKPELIVWDSFALSEAALESDSGLVAWVYRFDPPSTLTLDGDASRVLARELAAAYRAPLETRARSLARARAAAARALEAFANGECTMDASASRAPR